MASPSPLHRSLELAGTLPALMVAADRVAVTVIQGVHGRRRVGQGDAFWQYRPYRDGDSASQIDWRQSARSRHLFVRETEWEAAASVWLWRDASPSMQYASLKNIDTKAVRAELITLALASLLADAGERVTVLGSGMRPTSGRIAVRRIAETLFDGGRRRATSESARANYDAAVANYRQTSLIAFQEVEDNVAVLRILQNETQQQQQAVASSQESLQLFTNRYKGGVDTYLQVITAQTIELANERNAIDILRRRLDASVLLIKALGGGWNVSNLPTFGASSVRDY